MTITTNYMSLTLPEVGDAGPTWASQINDAIVDIDAHNHTNGNGRPVPIGGISVDQAFEMNDYNITEINSLAFNQKSVTSAPVGSLERIGADLYFVDGNGNNVRLTNGGSVNVSISGGIGGDYGTGASLVSYSVANTRYNFVNHAGSDSVIRIGGLYNFGSYYPYAQTINGAGTTTVSNSTISHVYAVSGSGGTLNLPPANGGTREIVLKDSHGVFATTAFTVAPNGSDSIDRVAASMSLRAAYGVYRFISDGVSNWLLC